MEPTSAQVQFWHWFKSNGNRLRAIMYGKDHSAREAASAEMIEAAELVQPGIIVEFGPVPEGQPLQLIVSAQGRPELVDAVKDLVASAPPLPGWSVVAF